MSRYPTRRTDGCWCSATCPRQAIRSRSRATTCNSADRVSMRYFRNKERQEDQGGGDAEAVAGPQFTTSTTAAITETHIFSPGLLSEFRVSYLRLDPTYAPSPANKTPRELGGNWNPDGPFKL